MIDGFGLAINIPNILGQCMRDAKELLPLEVAKWSEESIMYFFADERSIDFTPQEFHKGIDGFVIFSHAILKELPQVQMLEFLREIARIDLFRRKKAPIFPELTDDLVKSWISAEVFSELSQYEPEVED
jgi:hypothetical protein